MRSDEEKSNSDSKISRTDNKINWIVVLDFLESVSLETEELINTVIEEIK